MDRSEYEEPDESGTGRFGPVRDTGPGRPADRWPAGPRPAGPWAAGAAASYHPAKGLAGPRPVAWPTLRAVARTADRYGERAPGWPGRDPGGPPRAPPPR